MENSEKEYPKFLWFKLPPGMYFLPRLLCILFDIWPDVDQLPRSQAGSQSPYKHPVWLEPETFLLLTRRLNPLSFSPRIRVFKVVQFWLKIRKRSRQLDCFPVTFGEDNVTNGQGKLVSWLRLSISTFERQSRGLVRSCWDISFPIRRFREGILLG